MVQINEAMKKLKPITRSRTSLVDVVVERIHDAIVKGGLAAGDRLPSEFELSSSLQVSRTVLREAIRRLEAVGLLEVRRGSGMYVGDRAGLSNCMQLVRTAMRIAPREMLLFAEFRAALEIYCARRAAELATPEDLLELTALCEQMDSPDLDEGEAMRIDFEFHRKLTATAGNELMDSVMDVVREFVVEGMERTTPHPRDTRLSRRRHRDILAAIESGDAEAAEKAMRIHMDGVLQRLL